MTLSGTRGDAILIAFGIAHDDGAAFEVEILDAQAQAFEQTQPTAVEQLGLELVDARDLRDDAGAFRPWSAPPGRCWDRLARTLSMG